MKNKEKVVNFFKHNMLLDFHCILVGSNNFNFFGKATSIYMI